MKNVLSLILGGGRGTRLFPLTKSRSKPAMPLGGRYRLIDIPISNCINSGLNRIYVLTQFLSVSLHQHIGNTYKFDMFDRGFVEILAAQQTNDTADWYQGTADAVRRNIRYFREEHEQILVLSGDQLYRMDYRDLLKTHRETNADVTIAVLPVDRSTISGFGIVRVDEDGRVAEFYEKPKTAAEAAPFEVPPGWLQHFGVPDDGRQFIANMGTYVFRREFLMKILTTPINGQLPTDFGKDVFPHIVQSKHVQAHVFDGFWEDLGTIKAYHQVNLALADNQPAFAFHNDDAPIYTRVRNLPPSRMGNVTLDRVRLAEGCLILDGTRIERSVVGVRSRIGRNVQIADTVLIGADMIESDAEIAANEQSGAVHLGIGDHSIIRGAIIDKDCRIGRDVHIENATNIQDADHPADPEYYIRDGIIVIPRGTTIPNGATIPLPG